MPRRRRYPEVAAAVRRLLDSLGPVPLRSWLEQYFSEPGWVLARSGFPRWTGFVMESARVLGGSSEAAAAAGALVELAVGAIDIADDLIDGDFIGSREDKHRAMNAAVGLGLLTQRAIVELAIHVGPARATHIAERAARWSLASVDGQDRDVLLQARVDVSEDEALAVTRRKSGSLVRMAFEVGAAVATDDVAVIESVGVLGESVGLVAQLLNDLGGVDDASGNKTDFRARTKTAPVAYLLRSAAEDNHRVVLDWYANSDLDDPVHERELAVLARDLGAMDFAWILADTHRREAVAALKGAAVELKKPELLELMTLLPSVRGRPIRSL
jgi:geranylgeranyl diphosphate synthase, type I